MSYTYAGTYGPSTIQDLGGRPLVELPVTILLHGTSTLAILYTDRTKVARAANPTATDTFGNLTFYADPGEYDVTGDGTSLSGVVLTVDPSESLSGDLNGTFGGPVSLEPTPNVANIVGEALSSGVVASLAAGSTAVTQTAGDASTLLATDAFVMAAVSAAGSGLQPKPPVVAVFTTNEALSGLPPGLTTNQRVLNTGQVTSSQNGIWTVASGAWSRPADFASASTQQNSYVLNTGTGQSWTLSGTGSITVDTSPETWVPFSVAGLQVANNLGDVASALSSKLNLGIREYNIVKDYNADPTGVADSAAAINNALTAATNSAGLAVIRCPAGTYSIQSASIGAGITAPAQQGGVVLFLGEGDQRTIFLATTGSQMVNTTGISVFFEGICFDAAGLVGTPLQILTKYVGGSSLNGVGATATHSPLALDLNTTGLSATFPQGTLVNLQNTHTGGTGNTIPHYSGSVQSYSAGTGPGSTDQLIVYPTTDYPVPTLTTGGAENMKYGYGTNPVKAGVRRCRIRNRAIGYCIIGGIGATGTFTLTWGGSNVTGTLNTATVTAASLQTALNLLSWANAPTWICAPLGATQIVIYGIKGTNFTIQTLSGTPPTLVTNAQAQGFGVNFWDTSQGKPMYFEDAYVEDLTIENDLGDFQESVNFSAVERIHIKGINYRNTFKSRASINSGSNTLTFDGLLLSPPVAANTGTTTPGTPIAVEAAGTALGALAETGTVVAEFPCIVTMSSSMSAAEQAALVNGCTITVGAQTAQVSHVIDATHIAVNTQLTPAATQTVTQTLTPLLTTVTAVGTTVNGGGQTVTQLTLSSNAGNSVGSARVGGYGGRGPINLFAYDWADVKDVHATLGAYHTSDIGANGTNFGGKSISTIDNYTVDDPFVVAGNIPFLLDNQISHASNWYLPPTCWVKQSPFNASNEFTYVECRLLGGVAFANTATSTRFVGGVIGLAANNGAVGALNCSSLPTFGTGPTYLICTEVRAGTGVVFGSTSVSSTNIFEHHSAGGNWTFGTLNASFTGSHTSVNALSTSVGVKGLQASFFESVFNVLFFGGDPTGTFDSTAAIAAAIAAAAAAINGVVLFPPGTYLHSGFTIGNGTSSVPSTINGIVLRGGAPPPAELWDSTTYTSGVTLKYTGTLNGNAVLVKGPIRGFKIENLVLDGNSLAGNCLNLTSASDGEVNHVACKGFTQNGIVLATAAAGATYNTMHNLFNHIHISVPNVNNAEAIGMNSAFSSSDPCYNTFKDVEITFVGASSGHNTYGIYNGVSDSNFFETIHFINVESGTGGTNVCLVFDYTGATSSLPSDNTFQHIDFGTTTSAHAAVKFGSLGASGNTCRVYDIGHCNGAPADPGITGVVWGYTSGSPSP